MNEHLYRKKSMDRIISPDQLTDYLHVTNPGVWMILTAIILLLIGFIVWGLFGKIETKLTVVAVSENQKTALYVKEEDIQSIEKNMYVIIDKTEGKITEISKKPVIVNDEFLEYAIYVGELKEGEWVYEVQTDCTLEDGIYSAQIVTESISLMSFIWN